MCSAHRPSSALSPRTSTLAEPPPSPSLPPLGRISSGPFPVWRYQHTGLGLRFTNECANDIIAHERKATVATTVSCMILLRAGAHHICNDKDTQRSGEINRV